MSAPTRRVQICDDLASHDCATVGFEWHVDADVEDAYQRWISGGRVRGTVVAIENAPRSSTAPVAAPARRAQLALF